MQTTLDEKLGYINLGCLYCMFAFFSVFGPRIVSYFGPSKSMVIGCIAYVIVVSSNFFPTPYVQIPCNAINGVGAAILWTAQGVYLGRCALWDSRSSTKSFGDTANEYNGIFFSIFQFTGCLGATVCGVIRLFSTGTDTIVFSVLVAGTIIALIFLIFLPNVKPYESMSSDNEEQNFVSFTETLSLLVHSSKMTLMVPLIIFNGMSIAFVIGDIPRKISEPFFGKAWILFITAIFYGSNALFSYLCGILTSSRIRRRGTCLIAYLTQMIAFAILICYRYHHVRSDWTAIIATILLLALGDSVWESQPPAILQSFYGLDRERNAAMANLKMWQSLGNCVQFVLGVLLTGENNMVLKSIVLAVCLTLGYLCLVILDFKVCKQIGRASCRERV